LGIGFILVVAKEEKILVVAKEEKCANRAAPRFLGAAAFGG
jgi:hypothetical protein